MRCPGYSGFDNLKYKYNSFRNDKDKTVGIGSLKKIALEHGWQEDYSGDFEEVKDEVPEPEIPVEKTGRLLIIEDAWSAAAAAGIDSGA